MLTNTIILESQVQIGLSRYSNALYSSSEFQILPPVNEWANYP